MMLFKTSSGISFRLVCPIAGSNAWNAAFEGANTVNEPSPLSVETRSAHIAQMRMEAARKRQSSFSGSRLTVA